MAMRIAVIGTRGIPDIQGGVETHCQELFPRIAAMGHDVTVIRRRSYVTPDLPRKEWRGVKLIDLYTPRKKSLEAIVHTFLAVCRARALSPDIVHIHAVGPSLLTPLARLLGLRVVVTNHGPDYDRAKWGRMAKAVLRAGERAAARFANREIVISKVIAQIQADRYGRTDTDLIYNGVNPPQLPVADDYVRSLGLVPGRYVLGLGRFVEEKGFHDLIDAFVKAAPAGWKLVLAGDADHEDAYSRHLKEKAAAAGVVLTGFIKGEKLHQITGNAGVYAMTSYHEGLPIALLEALSYGLDAVVSNIPANRLECLDAGQFYRVGDVDALAASLSAACARDSHRRTYDLSAYNWDAIARQTVEVYRKAAKTKKARE